MCFALALALSPARAIGGEPGAGGDPGEWLSSSRVIEPAGPPRERTVILLHGFGGSPFDMEPLAAAMGGSGFRLLIPVIPGETAQTAEHDRGRLTVDDLLAWVRGLIAEEKARFGRKPHLVGFSMGGTLATLAAAEGGIDRLVLISPYFSLAWGDGFLGGLSGAVAHVAPVVPKPWKGKINDPEGYRRYFPGTPYVSLPAFRRLREMAERARRTVSRLPALPTLVLASPDDEVASFAVTESLFASRPRTRFVSFPGSNHILTYDYGRKEAHTAIRSFLEAGDKGPLH
jgi:alpha-beta hydrolase superfamily lysophospholipase